MYLTGWLLFGILLLGGLRMLYVMLHSGAFRSRRDRWVIWSLAGVFVAGLIYEVATGRAQVDPPTHGWELPVSARANR